MSAPAPPAMRLRRRVSRRGAGYAALLLIATALAGCGGISAASNTLGSQLTVYSSLPLQGSTRAISENIVNGEKLALSQAGGQVGPFKISYVSMDDSSPVTGQWDPGATSTDAKDAAQDNTTIAYLGDYNSAATAISLPLVNAAGILQVSPASPYVGLTSSQFAGQDEPDRFYPTGVRTFGRLIPDDRVQGAAQASLLGSLGVHRLYVIGDENAFEAALASIVASDARGAGIQIVGNDNVDTAARDYTGEVKKIVAAHPDAVTFAGGANAGAVMLWRQLAAALPSVKLIGSSGVAVPTFTTQLGSAAANTYLTTPILAPDHYPPLAQKFFRDYEARLGQPATPYALYGYEAMQVTLQAIRDAGSHGDDRTSVIQAFFRIRNRDSVLGRYSVQADGDTTLSDYAVDRVVGGQPVFLRAVHVGAG